MNEQKKRIKIIDDMISTTWSINETMKVQKVSIEDLLNLKICELSRIELKTDWKDDLKQSHLLHFEATDLNDFGVYRLHHHKSNKSEFYYSDGQNIDLIKPNEVFNYLFKVERNFTINKILGEL